MTTIIFLILGLIIGSFLNAVVYRLNAVESLLERSHCPKCKKKIRWFDNIPLLSFILLSAKCRDCGEKISWQYPLVELTTGIVFALVGNYFFLPPYDFASWLLIAYYLSIFSLLLIVFVYDLQYMEIPMIIVWAGIFISMIYFLSVDWQNFHIAASILNLKIVSGILGGLLAFLFFFGLAAYSKETWMGYGDAYIGMLAGLIVGWPSVVWMLMLSFTIGAIISVSLILFGKKTMKSQIPFAPFLIAGVFLIIILPQIFPSLKSLFTYLGV